MKNKWWQIFIKNISLKIKNHLNTIPEGEWYVEEAGLKVYKILKIYIVLDKK